MLYQPPIMWDDQYFIAHTQAPFLTHWHGEIELLFSIKGELTVKIDDDTYTIVPDEALIINSNEEHEITYVSPDGENVVIEIGYGLLGSEFSEIASRQFTTPKILFDGTDSDMNQIRDILHTINNEHISNVYNYTFTHNWMIKGKLFMLASLLCRCLPMSDTINSKRAMKQRQIMTIQPLLEYIGKHYNESITVNDAASMTGYETNSFCRLFKNITGMTFHNYLNMHRINQACMFIEYGGQSLREIGELCGIPHAKSFSRIFRQYKNITPSEYRSKLNHS